VIISHKSIENVQVDPFFFIFVSNILFHPTTPRNFGCFC